MALIPAIGYSIATIIFYFGYKLDENQVVTMQKEIEAKKISAAGVH